MANNFDYINTEWFQQILPHYTGTDGNRPYQDLVVVRRLTAGLHTERVQISRYYDGDQKPHIKKLIQYFQSRGYVTRNSPAQPFAIKDSEGAYPDAFFTWTFNGTFVLKGSGDLTEINEVGEWFKREWPEIGAFVQTATGFDERNRLMTDSTYLLKNEANLGIQSFYPWLNVSLEDYIKAYMDSKESVLIFFGPPGTGKSTLLRTMICLGELNAMLAYNRGVVESPFLLSSFYRGSADLLAYEDIDNHLKSRESGNMLMSTILNASEGVVKHDKKKIVFSTNLNSIDKIDPALLRVGRCFDIMQFRNLTPDEADQVLIDVGRPPQDFSSKDNWPLSEVLAEKVEAQQVVNRFARKAGFV